MHIFNVVPNLHEELKPLLEIAYNLWHTWNPEALTLFMRMDRDLWEECNHNPVLMLGKLSQEQLNELTHDEGFMMHMERVYESFRRYIDNNSMFQHLLGYKKDFKIAYFSAEFGINDSVPIYSGGLGILSGDHLKSASDLNVPIIAVGLMYQQGYFRQYLTSDGWQQETYPENDFHNMPMKLLRHEDGTPVTIDVKIQHRTVYVRVWKMVTGRIEMYMLDTNNSLNLDEDKKITDQLYGGGTDHRLKQEIVLGIGGVRMLSKLGIEPAVFHMNEGHSAFVAFERIHQLRQKGLSFEEAKILVSSTNVFTTHTPVPAGNDVFSIDLMYQYFSSYGQEYGIPMEEILSYGRIHPENKQEGFCMTVLAMKMSSFINGVSKLHGFVSRKMWKELFPLIDVDEVPIKHITNGVHIPSWISLDMATLYFRYLGPKWMEDPDNKKIWDRVGSIPDEELWRTHERRRERLVAFIRKRLSSNLKKKGAKNSDIMMAKEVLNPEALTIGFARRFATYKRGNLILKNPERLAKILNNPEKPVQIIFAGKAHPRDMAGKEIIKQIIQLTKEERFKKKIIFIEDYDINVARYLVQGVDVWLNNPRRPLEASGTSGMKASANGALNLSILDGWWVEAYNGQNGWAIGSGEEYENHEYQDEIESRAILDLLEGEIVPMFYDRKEDNLPREWVSRMKNNLKTVCSYFNTHRMVEEYMEKFYLSGAKNYHTLTANNFTKLKELYSWKQQIDSKWEQVKIVNCKFEGETYNPIGTTIKSTVIVDLAGLSAQDIVVEAYFGKLDSHQNFVNYEIKPLEDVEISDNNKVSFSGTIVMDKTGKFGIKYRIRPVHNNFEPVNTLNYIKWDE
jgi:starch phosphorylase